MHGLEKFHGGGPADWFRLPRWSRNRAAAGCDRLPGLWEDSFQRASADSWLRPPIRISGPRVELCHSANGLTAASLRSRPARRLQGNAGTRRRARWLRMFAPTGRPFGAGWRNTPRGCRQCWPLRNHEPARPSRSRDRERVGERGRLGPVAARLIFAAVIGRVVSQSRPELAGMSFLILIPDLEITDCFTPAVRMNRRRQKI